MSEARIFSLTDRQPLATKARLVALSDAEETAVAIERIRALGLGKDNRDKRIFDLMVTALGTKAIFSREGEIVDAEEDQGIAMMLAVKNLAAHGGVPRERLDALEAAAVGAAAILSNNNQE